MVLFLNINLGIKFKYCFLIKFDVRICKFEFLGNWLNWLLIVKVIVGNRFFGFSVIDLMCLIIMFFILIGECIFKLLILLNFVVR